MAQKTAWTGAALTESDIVQYLAGEGGAWTSWTPTVTQSGSVTVTNTRSRYARYGRTIHVTLSLSVTGSGTGSNAVYVSLPATAAANGIYGIGGGSIFDTSASAEYRGLAYFDSTTTVTMQPTDGSTSNFLGVTHFTAGLASGDLIRMAFTYEASS